MQSLYPESGPWTAPNWPKIKKMTKASQFHDMTSTSNFFDAVLFLLSILFTAPSFMSIASLVLELLKFSFTRNWREIRKSEKIPFEFCPIIGDWGKLWILNLPRMFLIECMLLNAAKFQCYSFYSFWVIKRKATGG